MEDNMKKPLKPEKYLHSGKLTTPWIDSVEFKKRFEQYKSEHPKYDDELILLAFFLKNKSEDLDFGGCKSASDIEFRNKNRFSRTAQEIWKSKQLTGCTDYATVFACFARQLGIPTTMLHSVSNNWLNKYRTNTLDDPRMHKGHTFCECYYKGNWILVDPTFHEVIKKYDLLKSNLHDEVDGDQTFYAYKREIDLGKPLSTGEFNEREEKSLKR